MGSFSVWHWLTLLIVIVSYVAIFVVPIWKIVSKAGYSGALSLLTLIPFVNIIMLWVFAFSKWPNSKE